MKSPHKKPAFPSKDDLLAFIGQAPGKIGTREVARAFGLKNADRATLKRMLRQLADAGLIERRRCITPAVCPTSCSATSPPAMPMAS